MAYPCVASSLAGFIQQIAVGYVGRGYWFYVAGEIPAHKDPEKTDAKILGQYGIAVSKWARARRKRSGQANLQYIRFGRLYVILSTHGTHPFFEAEAFRDVRREPLKVCGYSIGYRRGQGGWHPSVRIELEQYLCVRDYFLSLAVHRSAENLARAFRSLPFEPYAPVRQQLLNILRAVNRSRKAAGFEPVPLSALRLRRRPVPVFGVAGPTSPDSELAGETGEGKME